MGLENPNSGLDPGETFFPNSVSDLDSAETFQISRNLGLDIDETVCLLDSQLCLQCRRSLVRFPAEMQHSQMLNGKDVDGSGQASTQF